MDFTIILFTLFFNISSLFNNITGLKNEKQISNTAKILVNKIETSGSNFMTSKKIREILSENNVFSYRILPFFYDKNAKDLYDEIKIFLTLNAKNYNRYGYYEGKRYISIILVDKYLDLKVNKTKNFKRFEKININAKVLKRGIKYFSLYIKSPSYKIKKLLLPVINKKVSINYKLREKGKYVFEFVYENNNDPLIVAKLNVFVEKSKKEIICDDEINDENSLLRAINEIRIINGLKRIDEMKNLSLLARKHSEDMAENNFFSHISSFGKTPYQRIKEAGIGFKKILENIAQAPKLCMAHNEILESPGHLMNILDREIDKVGLGIYVKRNLVYLTEDFIVFYSKKKLEEFKRYLFSGIKERGLYNSIYLNLIAKRKNENEFKKINGMEYSEIYVTGFRNVKAHFFILNSTKRDVLNEMDDLEKYSYYGVDLAEYRIEDKDYLFLSIVLAKR